MFKFIWGLLYRLALAVGMLGVTSVLVLASDWTPVLLSPESGIHRSDDPVQIQIEAGVSKDTLLDFGYELDGIDVTGLATVVDQKSGYLVSLRPPQPLSVGAHDLRLVEYTDEGELIERGVWQFSVTSDANLNPHHLSSTGHLSAGGEVTGNTGRRYKGTVDDDQQGFQGAAQIDGEWVYGNARLASTADFVLQSPRQDQLYNDDTTHDIELGKYLFSGESPSVSAMLGHHAIGHQGLLMQDFHRRGASLTSQTADGHVTSSGFAFRTEPITGWRNGFGIGDDENRVIGGAISLNPLGSASPGLQLTAMALRGEGSETNGVGVAGNDTRTAGDGAALIAESHLADGRIRTRLETATTDYVADPGDPGFGSESGRAHSLLTSFIPWRSGPEAGISGYWELGVEYQEVDAAFRSLANVSLPGDRSLRRVFSDWRYRGFGLQAQFASEQDNVADAPQLPVLENDIAELAVSWSLDPVVDDDGMVITPWYGHPQLFASSQVGHIQHKRLATEFESFRVDSRTPNHLIEFGSSFASWDWLLGYGWGKDTDRTGNSDTVRNDQYTASVGWRGGDRMALNAYLQIASLELGPSFVEEDLIWGISSEASVIPDRLDIGFEFGLNETRGSNDLSTREVRTLGVNLEWQLLPPKRRHSGVAFWLRGEQQQIEDRLFPEQDGDPYAVLLGVRFDWDTRTRRP